MTWRRSILTLLLGAGCATSALAGSIDLNLNNDIVEASYSSDPRTAQYRFGGLYDDRTKDWLLHAGFVALGEYRNSYIRSDLGLGGRVYSGPTGNYNILAVALGGQFSVYLLDSPIGLGGYVYYAPNVLSALDSERFFDMGARIEFEIIKRTGVVYVGYRRMEARFENVGSTKIDEGAHLGMRIAF